VNSQFRKTFFVHQDPDLFAGFPIYIGAGGDSSAHLVDLNGSGHDSIVVATDDGRVHAFQADGSELPGWPVETTPLPDVLAHPDFPSFGANGPAQGTAQAFGMAVAVGSLNGDGKLQVVAGTLDGQLYAWNADGSLVSGFPVTSDPAHYLDGTHDYTTDAGVQVTYVLGKGFFTAPVLYDLGGTGKLEIIAAAEDGYVYVWDHTGTPWPGFPLQIVDPNGGAADGDKSIQYGRLMSTPAVGDINGDGHPVIILGSNEAYGSEGGRVYAVWADGNNHAGGPFLPGWPIDPKGLDHKVLPDIGLGVPNAAALADLDGSGKLVIATNGIGAAPGFYNAAGEMIGVVDQNSYGSQAASQDIPVNVIISHGSFGDIDGDGKLDFVDGTIGFNYTIDGLSGTGNPTNSHAVTAWSAGRAMAAGGSGPFTAEPLPGFPALAQDFQFFMNYAIADIDGDGKNEVLSGSGVYLVNAYRADGTQPTGWPKNTGGWVVTTPAVGDLEGDGTLAVVVLTREGWLWAWHGAGPANEKIEWDSFHHDAQNTGNYGIPLETRSGPKPASTAKSGCSSAGGADAWLGLFGALMLLLWQRRRTTVRPE
jgi:MYXO-CTERM domain-containing protein